jgi:glycosyltransferase involved in cell wall biosynthesis
VSELASEPSRPSETSRQRPLRVTLVTPGFPPEQGGVESHTGALARELAALGVQVRVLTARRGLRRAQDETRDGVAVRVFPAWRTTTMSVSPRLLFAGLRAFRHADVVHVHSYHAACGFAALSGLVAPVVFTPHYHGDGHTAAAKALHRAYRFVGRLLLRAARAVICVSRAEEAAVLADVPAVAGRTHVLPNGVDTALVRAARPYAGEPPTVVSLGRLEPYKGVATLLRAAGSLPDGTQVVVIGEGSQRAELEKLAAELGVADRVRFLGVIDGEAVHRWLRTAAVLVSLSDHEAFGMAPIEAACAGARVVLSDIPAHREIVAEYLGAAATLLTPAPDAVAAAVSARLAEAGRVAVDVPDWSRIAAATLDVYRAVCPTDQGEAPT